jgi:chromosome segregation ATPase
MQQDKNGHFGEKKGPAYGFKTAAVTLMERIEYTQRRIRRIEEELQRLEANGELGPLRMEALSSQIEELRKEVEAYTKGYEERKNEIGAMSKGEGLRASARRWNGKGSGR